MIPIWEFSFQLNVDVKFSPQGSFHFLKKEIPTRLANMIMELKLLPHDLMSQRECTEILSDYISSFKYLHCKFLNYQMFKLYPDQGDGEI